MIYNPYLSEFLPLKQFLILRCLLLFQKNGNIFRSIKLCVCQSVGQTQSYYWKKSIKEDFYLMGNPVTDTDVWTDVRTFPEYSLTPQ